MLHIRGILSDKAWDASWALDHTCVGRDSGKNIHCPFQNPVPVLEKFPQNTNYRIYYRTLVWPIASISCNEKEYDAK